MRRRMGAKESSARFNRIFREPTGLDIVARRQEAAPDVFLRLWLCPDTMDLETWKGREAREEMIRLAGECYRDTKGE